MEVIAKVVGLAKKADDFIENAMVEHGDDRVKDWPLMSSPWYTIYLSIAYVIIVMLGTWIMKNRKPFELRIPLIIHNAILVFVSGYMCFYVAYEALFKLGYGFVMNPVNYGPEGLQMAKVMWLFYFSKSLEFGDTFFMILRKKNNQVSFLHLYHHVSVFSLW
eukprot:CAMPEP_0168526218 /NCGR_PEP_ID=MMETSP0405-20121227/11831_1 /TAXON_ID=498012 /ORGANISM="Trichosphaerium sp, Strain Am-I-7 wt" /LENGTH=161 /DNA_ID=CAMNT_0008549007 /DNA_START=8 /DNA_END=490 /DNA_ORIENTATION=-